MIGDKIPNTNIPLDKLGRYKYRRPKRKTKSLIVSDEIHTFIMMYAHENGMTIEQATARLLGMSLANIYDLELEE